MVDLQMCLFSFTFKDVLGEIPRLADIQARLKSDLDSAVARLGGMKRSELERVLNEYLRIKRQLDLRAGSMAVPHEKVEAFTEAVSEYVFAIRTQLEKTK
jgi:phosphoserine phosphatase